MGSWRGGNCWTAASGGGRSKRESSEVNSTSCTEGFTRWDIGRSLSTGGGDLRALLGAKTPAGITQTDLEELFVEFLDEYGLSRPRLTWRQLRDERDEIAADLRGLLGV